MPVVSTVGGSGSDSYADETYYKSNYSPNRLPAIAASLAPTATDGAITVALIIAARMIDNDFVWTGVAADPASDDPAQHQALTWPRRGMLTRNGFSIPATIIPRELKDAQCEIAYQLLGGSDLLGDDDAQKNNLQSLKAGSVALSFQRENTSTSEGMDIFMRRLGSSEFNYISRQITGEVRRLLVPSWFEQPSIIRPVLFGAFAGSQ